MSAPVPEPLDPPLDHPDSPLADDIETVLREWKRTDRAADTSEYEYARAAVTALMRSRRIARTRVPEPAEPLLTDIRAIVSTFYDDVPADVGTGDAVLALGRAYRVTRDHLAKRYGNGRGDRVDGLANRLMLAERLCLLVSAGHRDGPLLDHALAAWRIATAPTYPPDDDGSEQA